jgi:hypothetical protein
MLDGDARVQRASLLSLHAIHTEFVADRFTPYFMSFSEPFYHHGSSAAD